MTDLEIIEDWVAEFRREHRSEFINDKILLARAVLILAEGMNQLKETKGFSEIMRLQAEQVLKTARKCLDGL